jgi:hypothetical protein
MYPDPQRLENIMSIRDAMRQISQEADAIVELLDARIEAEHLDGSTEAEDVREVLELIQSLTLEVSEDLDAYQEQHSDVTRFQEYTDTVALGDAFREG